ncbi:MAG TPA: hypothetical protein VH594_28000 [Trebonia sp.]
MNTTATATASCPSGTVLVGGGADVANSNAAEPADVQLIRSRPAGSSWEAIGVIDVGLGASNHMTVTAYALCATM